ncbi:MAG: hypothetical protein NC120_06680 [Ruminococcus sp.]|nr:hypothetical protein [Ruminococcus sp.]
MLEALIEHYIRWSREKEQKIENAAKKHQRLMRDELINISPVRHYPHNGGIVRHITANRIGNIPAKRQIAPEYEQPGTLRSSWIKSTVSLSFSSGKMVYAVRNKNLPSVIHLLNFERDHYSHGKMTGELYGSYFVTSVQERAQEALDIEIAEIMEEE